MSWNAFKTPRRRLQHKIRKKIVFSKEVSRKIHFPNKLFRSNLQDMFWKLAGATNSHLRRNLFVSKVATYSIAAIFQRLLVFSNTSFRLFPKIQDREKCPISHRHANHILRISTYSVQMRENTDQNNSE